MSHSYEFSILKIPSKIVTWYFREIFATGTLQGSYSHTYPQQIRAFPIRRIDFTTPAEERQQRLAEAIALYQNGQIETLLAFSQARLEAQPEQADVVHDLLAFVAGQMIEMNKAKQRVTETFWLDLEGVTDAATFRKLRDKGKQEAGLAAQPALQPFLNPDSHSIRTLEESLAWNEEAFRTFARVLAGKITGLSDLVDVYRRYSPTYRRLVERLATTDWLIDQIVYQLYGLDKDEIKIVEGD